MPVAIPFDSDPFSTVSWGGRRLETVLGRHSAPASICRDVGNRRSRRRPERRPGRTVCRRDTWANSSGASRAELLGRHHPQPRFPLLLKYLDASGTSRFKSIPTTPWPLEPIRPTRQNRGLDRPGGRAGEPDLCGPRPGVDRGAGRGDPRGTCQECLHGFEPSPATACSFRPERSTLGGGAARGRDSAVQRHDVPAVRLESPRPGRKAPPAARRARTGGQDFGRGPVNVCVPRPSRPCSKDVVQSNTAKRSLHTGRSGRCQCQKFVSTAGKSMRANDPV